jgi:nicotinamide-nucleotide amidase
VVAYATDLKSRLVGVDDGLLRRAGAVDAAVAEALAHGVRDRLGASWGVGITGVAGPEPQDGKPVGTVFVAVVGPGEAPGSAGTLESVAALELGGDRNRIRSASVEHAVGVLRAAIVERGLQRR